jgi:hypothetical protein
VAHPAEPDGLPIRWAVRQEPVARTSAAICKLPGRARVRSTTEQVRWPQWGHGPQFRRPERDQLYLLAPSLSDWLPEDHLAWFVCDCVEEMDLDHFYARYREDGWGGAAHHPKSMVALRIYGYCLGVRSSRQIERACQVDVGFRVICAGLFPRPHDRRPVPPASRGGSQDDLHRLAAAVRHGRDDLRRHRRSRWEQDGRRRVDVGQPHQCDHRRRGARLDDLARLEVGDTL